MDRQNYDGVHAGRRCGAILVRQSLEQIHETIVVQASQPGVHLLHGDIVDGAGRSARAGIRADACSSRSCPDWFAEERTVDVRSDLAKSARTVSYMPSNSLAPIHRMAFHCGPAAWSSDNQSTIAADFGLPRYQLMYSLSPRYVLGERVPTWFSTRI